MKDEPGARYRQHMHRIGHDYDDDDAPAFGPALTRVLNAAGYLAVAVGVGFFVAVWAGVLEVGR